MPKHAVSGSRPAGAYSPGIVAEGRFVYVSGQGPFREGVVTGDTAQEQTRVALEKVAAVLAEARASLGDVVRCGVFLADMADFGAMNGVFAEIFPPPLPARTMVGAALPGIIVEIDRVAVLPGTAAAAGPATARAATAGPGTARAATAGPGTARAATAGPGTARAAAAQSAAAATMASHG
jgi:enamine deaminase RidA (YjgF/YER057c/UK114 family)